jgi:probable rRNA maturation factor
MTYQIHIIRDYPYQDPIGDLEAVARAVLEHENSSPGSLSIVITSDEKVRDLNRRFAHLDTTTDVLTFSDGSINPETGSIYYGDITIALPVAQQQAAQANHPLAAELALLSIHGVLHLLGHDHRETEERKQMWQIQARIMDKFGYAFDPSGHEV